MCRINFDVIKSGEVGCAENYISSIITLESYYHNGSGWCIGDRKYSSDYYDIQAYIEKVNNRKLVLEERIMLALSVGYITKEIHDILPGIMHEIWPTPNILGIGKSPKDIYKLLCQVGII